MDVDVGGSGGPTTYRAEAVRPPRCPTDSAWGGEERGEGAGEGEGGEG